MSFIEFCNVSYAAGGADILSNVDFKVEEGEFAAVLGANGSGKSTLAKLMNGLLCPTSGKVLAAGLDTSIESEAQKIRRELGIVFQNPDNQIVASTVEDDVAFGPENLNVDYEEIERRIDYSLKLVGLSDKRKASPHALSGGQKQKTAIAGALAMNTRGLILDEATTMLDPKSREEVLGIIADLNKNKGITIIYITHFTEEILNADKVVVLDKGTIAAVSTPKEIFRRGEDLKKWNLEAPFVYRIADKLRESGIKLSGGVYTEDMLIDELTKFYGENNGDRD